MTEPTPADQFQYWRDEFYALLDLTSRVRRLQLEGDRKDGDGWRERVAILKELIEAEKKLDEFLESMETVSEDTINEIIKCQKKKGREKKRKEKR